MKFIVQDSTYKEQKLNIKVSPFQDVKVDDSNQFFVAEEGQYPDIKGFFGLLGLEFKFVLPPGGTYVYPVLLTESAGERLISYEDFIKVVEVIPNDFTTQGNDDDSFGEAV